MSAICADSLSMIGRETYFNFHSPRLPFNSCLSLLASKLLNCGISDFP
jgi:hypothetical protein